jgi:Glycogen recognition site of AMP-activated protein kinase
MRRTVPDRMPDEAFDDEAPDAMIDALAVDLRAPVALSELTTARIMAAVRADAALRAERRRRRARIWQSLAAAAVIVAAAGGIVVRERSERPSGTVVEFALPVASATKVVVVGDFNHWDTHATPLRRSANGTWRTRVRLKPGAHIYSFVVDGQRWVPDPAAPQAPGSDFGAPNSLVTVGPGAT